MHDCTTGGWDIRLQGWLEYWWTLTAPSGSMVHLFGTLPYLSITSTQRSARQANTHSAVLVSTSQRWYRSSQPMRLHNQRAGAGVARRTLLYMDDSMSAEICYRVRGGVLTSCAECICLERQVLGPGGREHVCREDLCYAHET